MSTQIRGQQIRLETLTRGHVNAAFEADLVAIESNIASIFSTMSTDTERMAAVAALTAAFETADGTLQGTITALVNATRAGAGLEADGSLVLPVGHNYLTGATSLKAALGLLDAALKTEETARIADVAQLNSDMAALAAAGAGTAASDLAAAVAAQAITDAAQDAAITAEETRATGAESALQLAIDNEVTARTNLNTTLSTAIANEATARTDAVSALSTTLSAADTVLQNNIDAEALARTTADGVHTAAIAQEVSDREAAVAAEVAAREAADVATNARVATLEGNVAGNLTYNKLVNRETPVGAVDGVNADFTLAYTPYAGSEMVFLNGMLLEPGAGNDYTLVGAVITLATAPFVGDRLKASYFR